MGLGLCLHRQGKLNESVTVLREAVRLQPDRKLYRNNLATVLVEAGQLDDALVLTIDPGYFSLTGGLERWLYRIVRKHAGHQPGGRELRFVSSVAEQAKNALESEQRNKAA